MKKVSHFISAAALIAVMQLSTADAGFAQAPAIPAAAFAGSQVAATVNGKDITAGDVKIRLDNLPPQLAQQQTKEQLRVLVLNSIVREQLLDKAVADDKIATTEEYKNRIEETHKTIAREIWLKQRLDKDLTDARIKKLYDDAVAANKGQNEVRARHILVKEEKDALVLIKRLEKGEDFAKLADEKTIDPSGKGRGGDLGYFRRGMMVPEFSDAALSMKAGEFSKTPVKTQLGWHVIKVEDIRPAKDAPFDQIKQRLQQEAANQLVEQYIQELTGKATIQVNNSVLNSIP
ncbi:MAG: peptidylprolyl isomerase [Holosporales bacterium]|jgi:peptidyl-prolyl cis-trans isomerase C